MMSCDILTRREIEARPSPAGGSRSEVGNERAIEIVQKVIL